MLQYESISISDFGGGITDDFKDVTGGKFSILDNIAIKNNRSAIVRHGTAPLTMCDSAGINAISEIENTMVALNGQDMMYRKAGGVMVATSTVGDYKLANLPEEARIERWRNMAITTAPDTGLTNVPTRTILLDDDSVSTQIASLPRVTGSNVADSPSGDRLYAVCIRRTQTDVNGFTYVDYSPELLGKTTATVSLSHIDCAAANAGLDSSEVTAALFVTKANGTTLYLVDHKSFDFATGNLSSTIVHPALADSGLDYKERGFFLSEEAKMQVPPCRYSTIVNNTGWYVSVMDGSEYRPYRVWQSVQGMPTSVIASAYVDIEHDCTGVGHINNMPIVLTKDGCYRIEGTIGIDGSGSLRPIRIAGSEGGISNGSIVSAGDKVYYAGTDGFYVTDGYSAKNVSGASLYKTYINYTGDTSSWRKIIGTYNRDEEIIHWVMPNNDVVTLHLTTGGFTIYKFDVIGSDITAIHSTYSKVSRMITKLSNAVDLGGNKWKCDASTVSNCYSDSEIYVGTVDAVITRVNAVSMQLEIQFESAMVDTDINGKFAYNKLDSYTRQLYIGTDLSKTILVSSNGMLSDTKVASDSDPTIWGESHIHWNMLTAGLNYGSPVVKKWVNSVSVSAISEAVAAISPYVINDGRGSPSLMKLISNRDAYMPADPYDMFGRSSKRFIPRTVISSKRHLPKGKCRCKTNQIGLMSTRTGLYSSYDYCKMIVTAIDISSMTITAAIVPVDGETVLLPIGIDRAFISVANEGDKIGDNLSSIVSAEADRTGLTFGHSNTIGLEVGDTFDWVITDYPKRQDIEILSLAIKYAKIGDVGLGFQRTDDARSDGGTE